MRQTPGVAARELLSGLGGGFIVGLPGLTAERGALWLTPPWIWVFVYGMPRRIHSVLSGWLVQAGLGRFLFVPEGFSAVLSQLARWFYPFGSVAHCNNYYRTTTWSGRDPPWQVSSPPEFKPYARW